LGVRETCGQRVTDMIKTSSEGIG